jgi:hypothetical protein
MISAERSAAGTDWTAWICDGSDSPVHHATLIDPHEDRCYCLVGLPGRGKIRGSRSSKGGGYELETLFGGQLGDLCGRPGHGLRHQ